VVINKMMTVTMKYGVIMVRSKKNGNHDCVSDTPLGSTVGKIALPLKTDAKRWLFWYIVAKEGDDPGGINISCV
jgi:hypothetical protein